MKTFVIREMINGTLISLSAVIARLPRINVTFWTIRDARFQYGKPFGIPLLEFERLTHEMQGGFVLGDADFRSLLKSEFQLIDGVIEAHTSAGVVLRIECVDATQWELSTDQSELIEQFTREGLRRV